MLQKKSYTVPDFFFPFIWRQHQQISGFSTAVTLNELLLEWKPADSEPSIVHKSSTLNYISVQATGLLKLQFWHPPAEALIKQSRDLSPLWAYNLLIQSVFDHTSTFFSTGGGTSLIIIWSCIILCLELESKASAVTRTVQYDLNVKTLK